MYEFQKQRVGVGYMKQIVNNNLMKTVTSEDNLSYFLHERQKLDVVDITKLNKKIKSIKTALKIAQKHNEELHLKIKNLKENHQLEVIHIETECKKYKQLYEMLVENYELKNMELKQYKKKLKRVEFQQIRSTNQLQNYEEFQDSMREFKETIVKQERQMSKLKEENKILYEQVYEKSAKIKQFQNFIAKNYISSSKMEHKDKSFLLNLKMALQSKNDQFEKLIQQKTKLLNAKNDLQKQNTDLSLKMAKLTTQLDYQKRTSMELKDRAAKNERDFSKISEDNRQLTQKYNELLTFSYDLQKDFEKQLHSLAKELTRKQVIKQI